MFKISMSLTRLAWEVLLFKNQKKTNFQRKIDRFKSDKNLQNYLQDHSNAALTTQVG